MDPSKEELAAEIKADKKHMTYTKWAVTVLLSISVLDVQLCFLLAYMGKGIPETLAVALVTEIVGVVATYMTKAYFETKEEEKNKLIRDLKLEEKRLMVSKKEIDNECECSDKENIDSEIIEDLPKELEESSVDKNEDVNQSNEENNLIDTCDENAVKEE